MNRPLAVSLLIWALAPLNGARAQGVDPNLMREVLAVRAEVARNNQYLRQYVWTEETQVLVKGRTKSSNSSVCHYTDSGELSKTPIGVPDEKKDPNALSKRPRVRKQADMQDYIQRAINLIYKYVPPQPEQMQYLLENGYASLGQSQTGQAEIRFQHYFKDADSLIFTYNPVSKILLRVNVTSNLGTSRDDPVSLEAFFETLPDGVNHLASATLNASAKKVQVKTKNFMYQKLPN
jgi:hypothetical protein